MSYYPRSATVRAETDCTMLEMLRNVLDIMQRNKTFREQLDRTYSERALDSHLRSVPMLASLTPEFIDHLRDRVELMRYLPGQVICTPGRCRRQLLSGAHGLREGVRAAPRRRNCAGLPAAGIVLRRDGVARPAPRAPRPAPRSTMSRWCGSPAKISSRCSISFPDVRQKLEASRRRARRRQSRSSVTQLRERARRQFLAQGLMEAQSLLVLDLESCTRCDQCVRACADAHDGVSRLIREGCASTNIWWRPPAASAAIRSAWSAARSARSAGAIRWRSSSRTGASAAATAPTTVRTATSTCTHLQRKWTTRRIPDARIAGVRVKATSCDLCLDHAEPSCVYACPHDAAHRVNPPEFFAGLLKQADAGQEGAVTLAH